MSITVGVVKQLSDQPGTISASVLLTSDVPLSNPFIDFNTPAVYNYIYSTLNIDTDYKFVQVVLVQITQSGGLYSYSFSVKLAKTGIKLTSIQGPQGVIGPTGLMGPKGPTGSPGDIGPPGDVGPQGDPGPTGATGIDGTNGVTGPTGHNGVDGPTGHDGATGPTGVDGIDGPTGVTGPTGHDGIDGPTGATGATNTTIVTAGEAIVTGNVVGIAPFGDGGPMAFLVDIAQAGVGTGVTPFALGIALTSGNTSDPIEVAVARPVDVPDACFDSSPSNTDIGNPVYASETPGLLTVTPITAANRWLSPIGELTEFGSGTVKVAVRIAPPIWLETDIDWTDETLCADFSVGAQVVQTAAPLWTTVGARFMVLVPGQPYYFKAVLAANDATSQAQIRWFANGVVIAGPAPAVTGTTVTSVQTTPAVVVGAGPMLIEAQVTLETAADPSTSRAICYSSTIVAYGEVLA